MAGQLDRLWPRLDLLSGWFAPVPDPLLATSDLFSKRTAFFFEMGAKMASQSELNWPKSFQKRSLKTTFAQGSEKGSIQTPLNLENRAPVRAPALFSLSHPCPKRCPKGSQKRPQGTLKSTKNSNKTMFNKKLQIDTDSWSCFWFPKWPKWSPRHPKKAPKTIPIGTQSVVENRLGEKLPPGPSQKPILECFGVRVGTFFGTIRNKRVGVPNTIDD